MRNFWFCAAGRLISRVGATTLFSVLIFFEANPKTIPEGIRMMERGKSVVEKFLLLLNASGPKDTSQYAKGIGPCAEAKQALTD